MGRQTATGRDGLWGRGTYIADDLIDAPILFSSIGRLRATVCLSYTYGRDTSTRGGRWPSIDHLGEMAGLSYKNRGGSADREGDEIQGVYQGVK